MLGAIALAFSELPLELIKHHGLARRIHRRGGELEVQFHFRDAERCLPVWHEGQLLVCPWGNRRGDSRHLPCTGWTMLSTVEAGGWTHLKTFPVFVPATMGLENGIWYRIRQGLRALLALDERGRPHVYVIVEPATHYYNVMTRSEWMPTLLSQRV